MKVRDYMNINLTNLMNLINNEEGLAYEKYRDW